MRSKRLEPTRGFCSESRYGACCRPPHGSSLTRTTVRSRSDWPGIHSRDWRVFNLSQWNPDRTLLHLRRPKIGAKLQLQLYLNRRLSIFKTLILSSRVEGDIASLAAAPDGPET